MPQAMRILGDAHARLVHSRRVRALADVIAPLMESGWTVLDVGCGDGKLTQVIAERRPPLEIEGLETSVRENVPFPVRRFDGHRIPVEDDSVDAVMLVDVLHHTENPAELLAEARRVARSAVILKDHRLSRPLATATLRFMDWVGNRPHGVGLLYNYWSEDQWRTTWRELGLRVDHYQTRLRLYPWAARWLFETGLHFLARLIPETPP